VQPWGEIAVAHVQVLVHALDGNFIEAYQEQASAVQYVVKHFEFIRANAYFATDLSFVTL
jgi:hypothetical protein